MHAGARMGFWGDDAGFLADNHDPAVALHAAAATVSQFVLISAAGVSTGTQRETVVDEDTDDGTPLIAHCPGSSWPPRTRCAPPRHLG
ncbi:hypothetical protein ACFYZ5_43225 [Streptomyces chartreusis]|uniref:hypothetical protein n=1 Tax=Streptomyces chartreusis TaxID=1969 RepID=UPI00369B0DF0